MVPMEIWQSPEVPENENKKDRRGEPKQEVGQSGGCTGPDCESATEDEESGSILLIIVIGIVIIGIILGAVVGYHTLAKTDQSEGKELEIWQSPEILEGGNKKDQQGKPEQGVGQSGEPKLQVVENSDPRPPPPSAYP